MASSPAEEIILRTRGISMLFPGTVALDNVDYNVWRGKVNVIIGENGAGKFSPVCNSRAWAKWNSTAT